MLAHPQLVENQKGFFVHKVVPDFTNQNCFLLDMSPQDNVSYYRTQQSDLRDVVLKPGIIYENTDVKFENVVDNKDGTFSIDITIKATKDLTLEPVLLDAANNGTNIVLTWDNRCTDCESDNYYIIEYREVGTSSWSESISNAVLTSESYTLSGIDMTKDYQLLSN